MTGAVLALLLLAPAPQQPPPASGEGPRGTSQDFGAERYDAVGYASWYGEDTQGTTASGAPFDPGRITAAHKTLPLGSFVEVTALDTGRAIVVVITDRGPNVPGRLIDLSRGAAQLLGTDRKALSPVRVRRIDPSPADQATLRSGRPASARLDASPQLLAALRKRLGVPAPAPAPVPASPAPPAPAAATPRAGPGKGAPPPAIRAAGRWFVQVAAFSTAARAKALAERLGGVVQPAAAVYRVRIGPFAARDSAERARERAARAGYGDARLVQE